jgi:hypothetical protein
MAANSEPKNITQNITDGPRAEQAESKAGASNETAVTQLTPGNNFPPAAPKKRIGAEETYSKEIADKICEEIIAGKTMIQICKAKGMPSARTVRRWLRRHPEFERAHWQARKLSAATLADEARDIADDVSGDVFEDAKGIRRTDSGNVNRARLQVDIRLKLASKYWPERFGEKIEQRIEQTVEITHLEKLTPAEVAAELSKLIGEAEREMNLTHSANETNEERIERIKEVGGGILPPRIYRALYELERGANDSIH